MTDITALPTLFMPRRLAISLLHEAQISPETPFAIAVGARDGMPHAFVVLDENVVEPSLLAATREALDKKNCALWSVYLHRPGQPSAPTPEDFTIEPALLRLTSSLATKGVLQLRAWRLINGKVIENQFHVQD